MCRELDIEICDDDPAVLKRKDDTNLHINRFSHRFFKEELARTVRRCLFNKIPARQDFVEPARANLDIYRTRFLLDTSFQSDEEWRFLQPFFERLPSNALSASIMRVLLQGSVYTNIRRSAAGMCSDDSCLHCGCRESHKHIFRECPFYESTRPNREYSCVSWNTGVLFESSKAREIREWDLNHVSLATVPFERVKAEFAFTDGSCFFDKWAPLRTSAAAVVFPGVESYAEIIPGADHSSTRAEIHAVCLALALSEGELCIVSDCAYVVNTFRWLQRHGFNPALIGKLDNADLWHEVAVVVRGRDISIIKVKAHVGDSSVLQNPWFTKHNAAADELAKTEARKHLQFKREKILPDVFAGLDLQTHLIASPS